MENIKLIWYMASAFLFVYLEIPQTQIVLLSVLMIIDLFTWIAKQATIDASKISSHNAWIWVLKKLIVLIAVLSVAIAFKALEIQISIYLKTVLWILIMSECYSIIQNTYTVRTWEVLPEYDVISILLKRVWIIIKSKIETLLK